MEFKVRSNYEERYGKKFIPDDMTIQDWGITYAELEPYYDKFEYTAAVSGKAGNHRRPDPARRQSVRGAARARISAAAADADPGERDVHRRRAQRRLSSVPAAIGQCVAAPTPIPTARNSAPASIAAIASASAAKPTPRAART